MTNQKKYAIINIENEREVNNMKTYTITITLENDLIVTKTMASSSRNAFFIGVEKFKRMYGDEGDICEVKVEED